MRQLSSPGEATDHPRVGVREAFVEEEVKFDLGLKELKLTLWKLEREKLIGSSNRER